MNADQYYYYQRAEAELGLAQLASEPAVVKAHYLLAGYYLDRVYGDGPQEIDALCDRRDVEALRDRPCPVAQHLRTLGVIIIEPPETV